MSAQLKARLRGAAFEFSMTRVAWRGVHAYRDAARTSRQTPSIDDVLLLLDQLVDDGALERQIAPGGPLWRWRP